MDVEENHDFLRLRSSFKSCHVTNKVPVPGNRLMQGTPVVVAKQTFYSPFNQNYD